MKKNICNFKGTMLDSKLIIIKISRNVYFYYYYYIYRYILCSPNKFRLNENRILTSHKKWHRFIRTLFPPGCSNFAYLPYTAYEDN